MHQGSPLTPYIVLEGIDGSGKDRHAALLRMEHPQFQWITEPSNGPLGKLIREVLAGRFKTTNRCLAEMFLHDRRAQLARIPENTPLLSSRSLMSSLVYQQDKDLSMETILDLHRGIRMPTLVLCLSCPVDTAIQRIEKRGGGREIFETLEHLREMTARYDRAAGLLAPFSDVAHVDTSGSVTEVSAQVKKIVRAHLERLNSTSRDSTSGA